MNGKITFIQRKCCSCHHPDTHSLSMAHLADVFYSMAKRMAEIEEFPIPFLSLIIHYNGCFDSHVPFNELSECCCIFFIKRDIMFLEHVEHFRIPYGSML